MDMDRTELAIRHTIFKELRRLVNRHIDEIEERYPDEKNIKCRLETEGLAYCFEVWSNSSDITTSHGFGPKK